MTIFAGVICSAGLSLAPCEAPSVSGWWSQYAEGISILQAEYHGYDPEGLYVALPDCDMVGSYVWISVNGNLPERVRVFDCLGRTGDPSLWGDGLFVGELSYNLADKYDVVGKGGVKGRVIYD